MTTHTTDYLIKERPASYTTEMSKSTKKTAIFHARISDTAEALIEALADHLGLSKTSVVEQAVRAFARQNGLAFPEKTTTDGPQDTKEG
jgi:hypothetical protein